MSKSRIGEFSLADAALEASVASAIADWKRSSASRRMWDRDASLWSGADEPRWLGWLRSVATHEREIDRLERLASSVRDAGFRAVVVLGMGGSSLAPDVFTRTFGAIPGRPRLFVLDSIVPAQILALERSIDLAKTLFVVASKSGSTTEPNVLYRYFRSRVEAAAGAAGAGQHFVAVTDPSSNLEKVAVAEGFREIAHGVPEIGGRFSALSNFGLVPAAIMGLDVRDFLARAAEMVDACSAETPPEMNPGVRLGLALGTLARRGRDKLTLVASPGVASIGAWLEQLVAESTGKHGKGVVPIDGEALGEPSSYGDDRVFVYTRLEPAPDPGQDAAIAALAAAGHPVIRIPLADERDLGQEMYRWEIATAVIGSVLGINPFDQPDVESAKIATKKLVSAYETEGSMPADEPRLREGELALHASGENASAVARARDLTSALAAHLARLRPGDYFAIQAYVEMSSGNDAPLQALRAAVRETHKVATTLGYGPRFLHSTGQLHKGGPPSGVFLQLTADDPQDLAVPGQRLSFGVLAKAQALGDLAVLEERGRRVVRIHLGKNASTGLAALRTHIMEATAAR